MTEQNRTAFLLVSTELCGAQPLEAFAAMVDMIAVFDEMNANPVNWVLLLAILYLCWVILAPTPAVSVQPSLSIVFALRVMSRA